MPPGSTPPSPRGTLASRLAARDRAVFAGRAHELRLAAGLFADDAHASVLLVHGPAGIGKSALAREIGRRGAEAGWTPVPVDGRRLAPDPSALEARLAEARPLDRPLVVLDGYDRLAGLGPHLRETVLPSLPEHAVVIVAGGEAPETGWFEDGWDAVVAAVELGPLPREDARDLLARRGLEDDGRADAIVEWASGWPLALRLAADAARADPAWLPGAVRDPEDRRPVDPEAVREALRSLHVPAALARSPLAQGRGVAERAASVRALIEDAARHGFGPTPDEQLLREILVRGYLEPAAIHERIADELHVSRSTYFRRLRAASERVAAYLAA